jgi:hypothetical protein
MADENAVWIDYDGRALFGDTDVAALLESFGYPDCKDDADAKRQARRDWQGHEFALYRYDLNAKREAENERLILAHQI